MALQEVAVSAEDLESAAVARDAGVRGQRGGIEAADAGSVMRKPAELFAKRHGSK